VAVPLRRSIALALLLLSGIGPARAERVAVGDLLIDRTEVTIGQFARFADATALKSAAEREGGGHEWGAGWERRPGWTFRTPFGAAPESADEPAVHVSWFEADRYCRGAGGRLPTRAEWSEAAYVERRSAPPAGFALGQRYPYPTGMTPEGANTNGSDRWPRHAPAGSTAAGVNGLQDMGGNVWEWLADRDGDMALTAGGSWWYGVDNMREESMQWKPAAFYVLYIGFRCVYPAGSKAP
jgi:formylglycine-generating enzyme